MRIFRIFLFGVYFSFFGFNSVSYGQVTLTANVTSVFSSSTCEDGFLAGDEEYQLILNFENQGWSIYRGGGTNLSCLTTVPNIQYSENFNFSINYPDSISVSMEVFENDASGCSLTSKSCREFLNDLKFASPSPGTSVNYTISIPNGLGNNSWGTANFTLTASGSFIIPPQNVPQIDSLTSQIGTINTVIPIKGQNFDQGSAPSVRFGAVKTNVISYNDTVINVNVPTGATFDPISVETDSGVAYSNEKFSTTFSGAEGISQNSFDLPQILSTGAQPHYVTTLDVDGDGKTDLITPNQGDNNFSVFRNIGTPGNPSFAARVNFNTGTQPREIAYGDLDNDGKPDLVVTNLGSNTASIYKNTSTPGTISFASKVDVATGTTPAYVQIRDFDGDGKPDFAVAAFNSNVINLFQNVGVTGVIDASTFVFGGSLSAGIQVHRLQAEDIDRDGKIDLIAPNYNAGTLFIYRNISFPGVLNTGSFAAPASISIGTLPDGLSIGDLNGNGYLDIACAASSSGTLIIRENQSSPGSLTFANAVSFPSTTGNTEVEIIDADGDGHLDVAIATLSTGRVRFFENSGNGGTINTASFKTPVDIFGFPCVDVEFADIDGDSLPDMIVPNVNNSSVSVYRRLLNSPAPPRITNFFPESGNVNSIVTIRGENFDINPLLNKVFFGNMEATIIGGVADTSLQVLVPVGADFEPISVSNIAGSAQSSKAFNTTFDGAESIYPGAFTKIPDISIGAGNPTNIDVGDLNGDGKADLAITKYNSLQLEVLINTSTKGNPSFQRFTYSTTLRPRGVVIHDIDVDGLLDIAVVAQDQNELNLFRNAGTASWSLASLESPVIINTGASSSPSNLDIADLDRDGKPDLIVTKFNANEVAILKNYSTPGSLSLADFPYTVLKNTGANPLRVKADDIDMDGKIDFVVGNYGSNTITTYHNTCPDGVIQASCITATIDLVVGFNPRGIAIGDLNGDGKPELGAVSDGSNLMNVYQNQSTPGSLQPTDFGSRITYPSGNLPLMMVMVDLDGNGKLDLASGNYSDDFVRILNNVEETSSLNTSSFQRTITIGTGDQPHDLAAIDIDGDSLTDLVTANSAGNSISIFLRNANPPPPPRVDSLSPQTGPIQSVVKVHGEHFNDTAANNTVWFGSTEGIVLSATESELDVEVPLGARFLPLTVTTSNGAGNSNKPFVTTYDRALGINSSSFEPRIDVPTGATTVYNAIGDLDGDGRNDIVQAYVSNGNILSVFRNTTTAANPTFATKFDLTSNGIAADIDLIDMDIDGKLDIVSINNNTGQLTIWRNIHSGGAFGPSSFAAPASILIGGTPNYVELRDIDMDGRPDIIAPRTNDGNTVIRKNLSSPGILSFDDSFLLNSGGSFCLGLTITDLNGDDKSEIIVGNNGSTFLSVFENKVTFNNPRASSFNLLNFGIGTNGSHGIASGDLDGDGDPDIGVVVSGSVRIFKNNSTPGQSLSGSSLAPYITLPLNASSTRLEFTDMDGDGKLDIVAANHVGGNSVSVIKNNSSPSSMTPGDFETPIILSTGPSSAPHFVSVADINNDSLPDIITSNNLNNFMSIFLRKLNPCQDPTLPVFGTSSDSVCAGDSTWIAVDGGSLNDASAWHWYTGTCGGTLIGVGDSIKVSATSNFIVRVRGEGGCVTPGPCYAQNIIVGNAGGGISASVNDTLVCLGDPLTFTASGGSNYQWSGGITNGQTFTTTSPGILLSYVTGEDAFGCNSTDSVYSFISENYSLADKGKFIGSGFESYIPLYFYCDLTETDSALYNFNSHWISFTDIFSFIFAPFTGSCPNTTSINISSDAYEGLNALRMDADTNGFAEASISGILAGRPNTLKGFFKTNAGPNDTIAVVVGAVETGLPAGTQDSSNYAGFGEFISTGSTGTYTQFEIPINYSGTAATDSFEISLVFVNSATTGGVKSVWFDAFEFEYDTAEILICQGDSAFIDGAYQTTGGLYQENFTTIFGCDSTVITELIVLPSPSLTVSNDTSICLGESVALSASGATNLVWSGGISNGIPFTPTLGVNTYTVIGDDGGTCGDTVTVSVTVNDNPNVSINSSATTVCVGSSVTLTAIGALNYSWTGGVNNGIAFNPPVGNSSYLVTGTDVNGCSDTSSIGIQVDAPPTAANAGPDKVICGLSTNLAANTISSGIGNWLLVSGPTGSSFTNNNDPTTAFSASIYGNYVLTWRSENGSCPASEDSIQITFDESPTPANAGLDQVICGTSTTLSANTLLVGTGNWTQVSGPGTLSFTNSNLSNSVVTASTAGIYTMEWQSSNGICPTASDTVEIIFNELPSIANGGTDDSVCGLSYNLIGSFPTIGSGQWTQIAGPGASTFNDDTANVTIVSPNNYGSYAFTWTISNGNCPASLDTVNVSFFNQPSTTNAGPDASICGLSGNLAGNPITVGTGIWTQDSGAGIATFTNANSESTGLTVSAFGTYIFKWRSENGPCNPSEDLVSITFVEPSTPANAGLDQVRCDTVVALAANNITVGSGLWTVVSGPGTVQFSSSSSPTASATMSARGIYTLAWTSTNGICPISSDTIVITIDDKPSSANAGVDQTLCGFATTLSANFPAIGTGTWTQVSGPSTASIGNNADPLSTIAVTTSGLYTFEWTISNGSCPPETDQVNITFDETPLAQIDTSGSIAFCQGETVTLNTLSPGSGTYNYQWYDGVSPISGATSSTLIVLTSGSYSVIISEVSSLCSDTSQVITVTVNPRPMVSAGVDTAVCSGDLVQLFGSGAINYTWDNGVTDGIAFIPPTTTTYTVIGFDANGCSDTANVTITVNDLPNVSLGTDTILCSDLMQTITLDAGTGFASYLWSDGSTNQTLLVDNSFFQANGSAVSIEVTNNNSCRGSDTVDVSFTICVGLTGTGQDLIRNIYPNPTSGKVIIELEESHKTRISILDQRGATLRSYEMNSNQMELDLGDLPSAKYFIQIQGDGIDLLKGIIKN